MDEKELKIYYGAYTDAWKLFKKYSNVQNDDDFWYSVTDDAESLYQKYKDTVAGALMFGLVKETVLTLGAVSNRR